MRRILAISSSWSSDEDADAVALEREPDVGLRLDRMHVEELGRPRDRAHRGELAGARDVEAVDADVDERFRTIGSPLVFTA